MPLVYFRKVEREFEEAWKLEPSTYPEPAEHCEVCSWLPVCRCSWPSQQTQFGVDLEILGLRVSLHHLTRGRCGSTV
jgi:hypothetical protein